MYFSIKMLNLRPSHLKNIFYLYIIYQSFSMVRNTIAGFCFLIKNFPIYPKIKNLIIAVPKVRIANKLS